MRWRRSTPTRSRTCSDPGPRDTTGRSERSMYSRISPTSVRVVQSGWTSMKRIRYSASISDLSTPVGIDRPAVSVGVEFPEIETQLALRGDLGRSARSHYRRAGRRAQDRVGGPPARGCARGPRRPGDPTSGRRRSRVRPQKPDGSLSMQEKDDLRYSACRRSAGPATCRCRAELCVPDAPPLVGLAQPVRVGESVWGKSPPGGAFPGFVVAPGMGWVISTCATRSQRRPALVAAANL